MTTTKTCNNKFAINFLKLKNNKYIENISKFLSSVWGLLLLATITLITHILAIEIVLYSFIAIYTVFVCMFCDDLLAIIPLFIFGYISPSINNNPGRSTTSMFYGASGIAVIVILAICLVAIFLRIGLDKEMGYKKIFTQKKSLVLGMLILGAAYLISGIGSARYAEFALKNILIAFLEFASIFFLYFIFSSTIKWKNVPKDYIAFLGIIMGVVVSFELIFVYLTQEIVVNGEIIRKAIYTGWGMYNNIGALIAMSIPFAFYLAYTKKHSYLYLLLATFLLLSVVLSCSRTSMLVAGATYLSCFIFCFFKAKEIKWYRIVSCILVGIAVILGIVFFDKIVNIFTNVPQIVENVDGSLVINDTNRFKIYTSGWNAFLANPILGQTFFPASVDYVPYDFSNIDSFSGFFPPRWHNTVIQLLASCGIIGLLAYGFHRYQTIKLFFKNRNKEKTFIGISILGLLLMSLLDCHFFNIGPTMIYSILLMFAEFLHSEDEQETKEELPKSQENNN